MVSRRPKVLPAVFLLVLAIGQTGAGPAAARAAERIVSFHGEIEVHADGSMTVRETIRAVAEGDEIRRGIYRDFPTRYRNALGLRVRVPFEVLEVRRDGASEAFHLEPRDDGVRVYVGRETVTLPHGEHVFELAYRTDRQIGFFADHDELYWNVTGNGWVFPIERASARVTLPATGVLSVEGYTGPSGSKERNLTASVVDGAAVFATTQPLGSHEGLTIVVGFEKGIVREPAEDERRARLLEDNLGVLAGLGGLTVLLLYYLAVWLHVGKDPPAGPLVVRYEPPHGLSPAAMRHLVERGFDDRAFAAAVLDLAVRGLVTIRERNDEYTLVRTERAPDDLPSEEAAALRKLFHEGPEVALRPSSHAAVGGAKLALREGLRTKLERVYFFTNRWYLIPGVLLSIGAVALTFLGSTTGELALAGFMSVWLTIWTIGVVTLCWQTLSLWRTALLGAAGRIAALGGAIFMTLFSLPFLAGEAFGLWLFSRAGSVWSIAILAAGVGCGFVFHRLLEAPTSAGRKLLDEVDGFRAFLTAVEGDRLQRLSPERTPELFERYLPHALALGVEQAWAAQFSDVLDRAGTAYRPGWVAGDGLSTRNLAGFTGAIGGSLAGAISSASTAPGSSSGGGGGGSSGGGGGGGGGGGW